MIFSKLDKKVLIILIALVVVILLAGFAIYKYTGNSGIKTQNSAGGAQTQTEQTPENSSAGQDNAIISAPQVQIQAQGENGGGSLSICVDKCGDGVCQKTDPNCDANNLSCICPETLKECPQDCKQ
ncbi:MAG: hypothetical protein NTY81_02585 [Candidatus Staskawiczbacteria bacterium]|nr:hypothetical protein [Candidatus Staskawiczbacteria bacterium]